MMPQAHIPHQTGLLLALQRVLGGRVAAHGPEQFSDHGQPFPDVLVPFLRELFEHGQVRLEDTDDSGEPSRVVLTTAGAILLVELEDPSAISGEPPTNETGLTPRDPHETGHRQPDPAVTEALALLDPNVWHISYSTPRMIKVEREWSDGTIDTLVVHSPEIAFAWRQHPVKGLVWRDEGAVGAVAAAVNDQPAPGKPDAPDTPLPDQPEGWT